MNLTLGTIWLWGAILNSINLHRGVEYPIISLLFLFIALYITVYCLWKEDKKNLQEWLEEYFNKTKNENR